MKKINSIIIAVLLIAVICSCADEKTINGTTYRPYGFFNEQTCKNDSIQYEVSGRAVCSGVIFVEMIVPPIYVFGYNLWQPVGLKKDFDKGRIKGVIKK